ncbi:MAG: rRNA maturation RNase YbeY [bacterium]|nr:rRNA maturation RNase YbeY [bacterium]
MPKNRYLKVTPVIKQNKFSPIPASFWREAVKQAVYSTSLTGCITVSVTITDDKTIKNLNRNFRGIDAATDVLSFSLLEGEGNLAESDADELLLGEIVISLETALRQAKEDGVSLRHMCAWLVAHSVLHLTGMDHPDEASRLAMNKRELEIIKKLGFAKLPKMLENCD